MMFGRLHKKFKVGCWFFLMLASFGCTTSYPWLTPLTPAVLLNIPTAIAHNPTGLVLQRNDAKVELIPVRREGDAFLQATLIWRRQLHVVSAAALSDSSWIQQIAVDDKPNHATVLAAAVRLKHANGQEQVIEKSLSVDVLRLPPLAVGDVIDIYIKRLYEPAWALPPWVLSSSVPTLQASLTVQAPKNLGLQVALGGQVLSPQEPTRGANDVEQTWHVVQHDLPGVIQQTDVGLGAGFMAVYNPGPVVVISPPPAANATKSWKTLAHWLTSWLQPSIEMQKGPSLALEEGVLTKKLTNIAHILRVDNKAAWFTKRPRSFAQLYAEGANSLEAAAIAAKISIDRGETAYIALVAPVDGPAVVDTMPGLYAFHKALVAWPAPHGWAFADPTCLTCATGQLSMASAGGMAWIVDEQEPIFATVPLHVAETNEQHLKFTWRYTAEGSLQGEILAELRGDSVERVTQGLSPGKNAVWHEEIMQQMLLEPQASMLNSIDLPEDLQDHPTDEPTHSTVLRFKTRAPNLKLPTGRRATALKPVDIAGAGFFWRLPKPAEKSSQDWFLPGPVRVVTTATVVGPKAFAMPNMGKPMHVQSRFGSYQAHFSLNEGVLLYERQVTLTARRVAAADLTHLFAFAHAIHELEAKEWPLYVEDE